MPPFLDPAVPRTARSMITLVFLVIPSACGLFGQPRPAPLPPSPDVVVDSAGVPHDHYFTLATATAKVRQQYPFATPAPATIPPGVTLHRDVVYRTILNRRLHMDVCTPPHRSAGAVPAVLMIHGGGWRSGDRSMELPMALQLAARGFCTATVEYRLTPEALYPAAVLDLKAAVRWLRTHADRYGLDTSRIAVYGCSSGGHLAALLGVTNGVSAYEEGDNLLASSRVQALVDIDGPLDLTHPEESGKDSIPSKPSSAKRWLGSAYADAPELWRQASPAFHLHKGMPPMLFVNSSLPRYHVGRDAAVDTMRAHGIYHEIHTIPDTPHPFWLFLPWQTDVVGYVAAFLERVFTK